MTTETKVAPTPWSFRKDERGDRFIDDALGSPFMGDPEYYPWCPDEDAEWRLMAAAPELLALARETEQVLTYDTYCPTPDCDHCERARQHLDAARALLAKIDGE